MDNGFLDDVLYAALSRRFIFPTPTLPGGYYSWMDIARACEDVPKPYIEPIRDDEDEFLARYGPIARGEVVLGGDLDVNRDVSSSRDAAEPSDGSQAADVSPSEQPPSAKRNPFACDFPF